MATTDNLIGAMKAIPFPASPHDFPLTTWLELRRAYRAYALANDESLIFDSRGPQLSPLGHAVAFSTWAWSEEEHTPCDLHDAHRQHIAETTYWAVLKERINGFLSTRHGREQGQILSAQLEHFLRQTLFCEGELPDGLYDRVVAAEHCWRTEVREKHKSENPCLYEREPPIEFRFITSFNADRSVRETEAVLIPESHGFEDFGKALCHHSGIQGARETDTWFYRDPLSEEGRWVAIGKYNFGNLKKLLIGARKQTGRAREFVLWHRTQIARVKRVAEVVLPLKVSLMDMAVDPYWDKVLDRFVADVVEKRRR